MKRILFCIIVAILTLSCYDDSKLKDRLDDLEEVTRTTLKNSISALEAASSQLKDRIYSLEKTSSANTSDIKDLQAKHKDIEKQIEDTKSWVEELMTGYYTKDEINEKLKDTNASIENIRDSISVMNNRLNSLLRVFKIIFNEDEIGILPGGTATASYKIIGSTPQTTVKALGHGLWRTKVSQQTDSTGTLTVYAPDQLTDEEIIVIVYDGTYRTIMSSINFVQGVITPSQEAVELPKEAGQFELTVNTNLTYDVNIPEGDGTWLSAIPQTKAMKTDLLLFSVTENSGCAARKGTICLVSGDSTRVVQVLQTGKNNVNLVLKHKASVLDFPRWSGKDTEGFITWNKGEEAQKYSDNFRHEYNAEGPKETVFEMYGVSEFFIADLDSVSHLSITHD